MNRYPEQHHYSPHPRMVVADRNSSQSYDPRLYRRTDQGTSTSQEDSTASTSSISRGLQWTLQAFGSMLDISESSEQMARRPPIKKHYRSIKIQCDLDAGEEDAGDSSCGEGQASNAESASQMSTTAAYRAALEKRKQELIKKQEEEMKRTKGGLASSVLCFNARKARLMAQQLEDDLAAVDEEEFMREFKNSSTNNKQENDKKGKRPKEPLYSRTVRANQTFGYDRSLSGILGISSEKITSLASPNTGHRRIGAGYTDGTSTSVDEDDISSWCLPTFSKARIAELEYLFQNIVLRNIHKAQHGEQQQSRIPAAATNHQQAPSPIERFTRGVTSRMQNDADINSVAVGRGLPQLQSLDDMLFDVENRERERKKQQQRKDLELELSKPKPLSGIQTLQTTGSLDRGWILFFNAFGGKYNCLHRFCLDIAANLNNAPGLDKTGFRRSTHLPPHQIQAAIEEELFPRLLACKLFREQKHLVTTIQLGDDFFSTESEFLLHNTKQGSNFLQQGGIKRFDPQSSDAGGQVYPEPPRAVIAKQALGLTSGDNRNGEPCSDDEALAPFEKNSNNEATEDNSISSWLKSKLNLNRGVATDTTSEQQTKIPTKRIVYDEHGNKEVKQFETTTQTRKSVDLCDDYFGSPSSATASTNDFDTMSNSSANSSSSNTSMMNNQNHLVGSGITASKLKQLKHSHTADLDERARLTRQNSSSFSAFGGGNFGGRGFGPAGGGAVPGYHLQSNGLLPTMLEHDEEMIDYFGGDKNGSRASRASSAGAANNRQSLLYQNFQQLVSSFDIGSDLSLSSFFWENVVAEDFLIEESTATDPGMNKSSRTTTRRNKNDPPMVSMGTDTVQDYLEETNPFWRRYFQEREIVQEARLVTGGYPRLPTFGANVAGQLLSTPADEILQELLRERNPDPWQSSPLIKLPTTTLRRLLQTRDAWPSACLGYLSGGGQSSYYSSTSTSTSGGGMLGGQGGVPIVNNTKCAVVHYYQPCLQQLASGSLTPQPTSSPAHLIRSSHSSIRDFRFLWLWSMESSMDLQRQRLELAIWKNRVFENKKRAAAAQQAAASRSRRGSSGGIDGIKKPVVQLVSIDGENSEKVDSLELFNSHFIMPQTIEVYDMAGASPSVPVNSRTSPKEAAAIQHQAAQDEVNGKKWLLRHLSLLADGANAGRFYPQHLEAAYVLNFGNSSATASGAPNDANNLTPEHIAIQTQLQELPPGLRDKFLLVGESKVERRHLLELGIDSRDLARRYAAFQAAAPTRSALLEQLRGRRDESNSIS
ncbi:unnamed protein product [Amoebophrya sp. A120]|nr:unnamed protein product [Amoebophrya sp. A120]|eukprot:GSA120T00020153001.1